MLAVTLITLTALEYGFRIGRDIVRGSAWISRAENVDDDELGWVLNPQKKLVNKTNACGENVVRRPPISPYLLKLHTGQLRPGLPVLFLGDSITQGTETSSDGLYYEVFEKGGGGRFAVSASGGGGFGTAQEFLLLQKVYPLVKPAIVFWQLSTNDAGENVFTGTDISTVQKPRPYYDPGSDSFTTRNPALWLLQHSELSKYMYGELMKIERSRPFGLSQLTSWLLPGQNLDPAEVTRRGLGVMERLLAKARKAYPDTWFIGFNAFETFDDEYRTVFERQGAAYIPSLAKAMQSSGAGRRLDCAPVDAHWNHEGNRVAAALLLGFVDRALLTHPGLVPH